MFCCDSSTLHSESRTLTWVGSWDPGRSPSRSRMRFILSSSVTRKRLTSVGAKTRAAAFLFPGIIPAILESSLEGADLEFAAVVLPHLDAAYTLARYLTRNDADAQDIVQDASLRALKYFGGFRGTTDSDGRAWFLAIVRNTAYTWRNRTRGDALISEFNEELHSEEKTTHDPVAAVDLRQALDALPLEFHRSHGIVCRFFLAVQFLDRKSTRLNSSHSQISYAVFC